MTETEKLKQQLETLKNEANSLLAENKVEEAEAKTIEAKIISAKIEVQEKLDEVTNKLEEVTNQVSKKDETIASLTTDLDSIKNEKTELMNKFTEATDTITNLNDKVEKMQPIVDKYNEDQYNNKLEEAKDVYKAKFEKVNASELFDSEEVQNLIIDTINEDETIATKAKFDLSEKIVNALDMQDEGSLNIKNIQEPAKETKNLHTETDEFEATYGFKR